MRFAEHRQPGVRVEIDEAGADHEPRGVDGSRASTRDDVAAQDGAP